MKKVLVFLFATLTVSNLIAATLHVDLNSMNPTAPYASRETAATDIQTAVNAAVDGDTVQVWDGHYLLTSQISVSKAITIQGVNGPDTTIVDGKGKVRCFNLGNTACVIDGMTITNGYTTGYGGGIYCSDTVPILTNCTIIGNLSTRGGGTCYGNLINCTITENVADYGGGMYFGLANNCTIIGNSASYGGGMHSGTTINCTISGNSAYNGGGMYQGTANNCTISGNSTSRDGGGMYYGTANNCAISGNSASSGGGGMYYGSANNCTISGNSAWNVGGMDGGTAYNCIVYYNEAHAGNDLGSSTTFFTCSPDVVHGVDGNITNAPMMLSPSRIGTDSPCRGAGSAEYASGTDIDGEPWLNPPSMGCDEYSSSVTGALQVTMDCSTSVVEGYPLTIQSRIQGAWTSHVWDFGDGTYTTNSYRISHEWSSPGIYTLTLTAFNDDLPNGVSSAKQIVVASLEDLAIHVSPKGSDSNDGTSWATAKATIQAGVDAQGLPGGRVLVGSGTYFLTNEITVAKEILIVGVDGPESTIVDGQDRVRCFNLGNAACIVSGLTMSNGNAGDSEDGGGIYCSNRTPVISNCIVQGNNARYGGGMYGGTANGCALLLNSASMGGAMYNGRANNCTITGNSAGYAGGLVMCEAYNCIVYYNTGSSGANETYYSTLKYSCSPGASQGDDGNITNAPSFVSSFHIAADSPCLRAGNAGSAIGKDIDGEAWGNPPSMGCDEPQEHTVGPLSVAISANQDKGVAGHVFRFRANITGAASRHVWTFDGEAPIANTYTVNYAWTNAGIHLVELTAYSTEWPDGVSATQHIEVAALEDLAIHVSPEGDDLNDGFSWATAKASIQAGVEAQQYEDGLVMMAPGCYFLTSPVSVGKRVHILGADGPESTIVDGQGSVRCFTLGNIACVVEGMTITNGYSSDAGGGIYCLGNTPVVINCIIVGNSASNIGGGMFGGTANKCIITGNSADLGGGMYNGTVNNCIITGNSAGSGGGLFGGTANNCTISDNSAGYNGGGIGAGKYSNTMARNCIVYGNTAPERNDLSSYVSVLYSCSPDAIDGIDGNITTAPLFADAANGDYRLNPNSPCINMGDNAVVVGSVDLDGLPRIAGGVVDMGAFEYQGAGIGDQDCDGLPDNWEVVFFGDTSSMRSSDDSDMDRIDNWSEWIAGTNPGDSNSVFAASVSTNQVSTGFVVEWTSVEERAYSVLWRGSLTNAYDVLQDGIEYPQSSYTDTVHDAESAGFYQIEVRLK